MVNAKPADAEAGIKALYDANAEFLTEDAAITQWTDNSQQTESVFCPEYFCIEYTCQSESEYHFHQLAHEE